MTHGPNPYEPAPQSPAPREPSAQSASSRARRRARRAADTPAPPPDRGYPELAREDTDVGWGEAPGASDRVTNSARGEGENDRRLREDRPPHHGS